MQYILTDIEGTSTSVAFVYEVLFPYFKAQVANYAEKNAAAPEWQHILHAVNETVVSEGGQRLDPHGMVDQLIRWTEADRKHPALKTAQGLVWDAAYRSGVLKGHVYPDVKPALERWRQAGLNLGVYSSGSVAAQKLLFGFSMDGNLLPFFSNYFDTKVGGKRDSKSYMEIARQIGLPPNEILFLSDVEAELDAAAEAGLHTIQLLRPGTPAGTRHRTAASFDDIDSLFNTFKA
ncbi:MAG: acireductone synthase [Bacteroidetes bacterium]|nr:acireductone synthase [Bacteroidota bacterium]